MKVDEDLPTEVVQVFASAGADAVSVFGQGWQGLTDDRLWPRVTQEGRMLATADKGFGDIRRFPPGSHPGIVVFRHDHESRGGYVRLAQSLLEAFRLEQLEGAVVVVSPAGIRVRR